LSKKYERMKTKKLTALRTALRNRSDGIKKPFKRYSTTVSTDLHRMV
jgi:hypothetical protein